VLVGRLWPKAESGGYQQSLARAACGHEPSRPAAATGRAALLPANKASIPGSWLFPGYSAWEHGMHILWGGQGGLEIG